MPNRNLDNLIRAREAEQSQIEITDLIGKSPGWLLHSGISMIAIVSIILLTGTYFFKYPDKLIGQGVLTSSTPPIEIFSRSSGYVEEIYFEEGEYVCKGDPILYINNTTDQKQLLILQKWIKAYEKIRNPNWLLQLPFVANLELGAVQHEYSNLQLKYNELVQTLQSDVVYQQKSNLTREIQKIKKLNSSQAIEADLYRKELVLINKDYKRNVQLQEQGVISELDLERAKTALLQKERAFEGLKTKVISNNIRIEQLELEKLKLHEQRSRKIEQYRFLISENIARIKAAINKWNRAYVIEANIDGVLTFNKEIKLNRNLTQRQIVGHIMPDINEQQYVSALYESSNIGKVEIGQKTILKVDAYPYKEYGVIVSEVLSISEVATLDQNGFSWYEIKFPIDKRLITDHGKELNSKANMTLLAEIITEDKTIFERIFNQFLNLINQQA